MKIESLTLITQAIKLINEAANQYFVGNAQLLKRLETVEKSLVYNAKILVPANSELVHIIGELAGAPSGKTGSQEEGVRVGDKSARRLLGAFPNSPVTSLCSEASRLFCGPGTPHRACGL